MTEALYMLWNRAHVENARLFQVSIRGSGRIPRVARQWTEELAEPVLNCVKYS